MDDTSNSRLPVFGRPFLKELNELKDDMNISKKESLKSCIKWMQFTIDTLKNEGEVFIKNKNGETVEIPKSFFIKEKKPDYPPLRLIKK